MARVSAGVYTNEFDFSDYAPQLGITTFAMLGGATKGPLNEPTLVTNEADLVRKFGEPVLTDYGLLSAIRFLRKGNRLMFVRVADDDPVTGVATADAKLNGAVKADGQIEFATATNPADGEEIVLDDGSNPAATFTFVAGTPASGLEVEIGVDAFATMTALVAAITAYTPLTISAVDKSESIPVCELVNATAGVAGNVAITTTGAAITVTGMANGADAPQHLMTVHAATPGTWANGIQIEIIASEVLGAAADARDMKVWAQPVSGSPLQVVEVYRTISLDPESPYFIETLLSEGYATEGVRPSDYVRADVFPPGSATSVDNGVLTTGVFTLGSAGNTRGADGIEGLEAADYVGTVVGQIPTGLQALRNPEKVEFNLIGVPGVSDAAVINALEDLCDHRADCVGIIDPPIGLDRDQVVAWHNGVSTGIPNAPTSVIDSNRLTLNWSWIKDLDAYSKKEVWLPPSGFIAANAAFTDKVAFPWFAIAGHNRGTLDGLQVEYSPDQDDRDVLCQVNGQNSVNPIVNFQSTGITLFGNKTLQRRTTALNSLHVRRMLLHAQKVIATSVKYLVFEPNDPVTWRRFTLLVNPTLQFIAQNQGLEKFSVICDETTNPPAQRNNKTMRGKIKLQPVLAAEIIEIDFALFAAGADFNEQ